MDQAPPKLAAGMHEQGRGRNAKAWTWLCFFAQLEVSKDVK
jgi:hypothetical protein